MVESDLKTKDIKPHALMQWLDTPLDVTSIVILI